MRAHAQIKGQSVAVRMRVCVCACGSSVRPFVLASAIGVSLSAAAFTRPCNQIMDFMMFAWHIRYEF